MLLDGAGDGKRGPPRSYHDQHYGYRRRPPGCYHDRPHIGPSESLVGEFKAQDTSFSTRNFFFYSFHSIICSLPTFLGTTLWLRLRMTRRRWALVDAEASWTCGSWSWHCEYPTFWASLQTNETGSCHSHGYNFKLNGLSSSSSKCVVLVFNNNYLFPSKENLYIWVSSQSCPLLVTQCECIEIKNIYLSERRNRIVENNWLLGRNG